MGLQVNWNGFPFEIPGMIDRHQHEHAYGVFVKSHEDTVACLDVFAALDLGAQATTKNRFPMGIFINDKAWAPKSKAAT